MRGLGLVCLWGAALIMILSIEIGSCSHPNELEIELLNHGAEIENKGNLRFTSEETALLKLFGELVGLTMPEIKKALSVVKIGLGVAETLESLFVKVFNGTNLNFDLLSHPGIDKKLLSIYEIVTLRLEQIKKSVEGTQNSLRSLVRGMPYMVRWEIALNTLEEYMKPINHLHYRFHYFQRHKLEVEDYTLLDFAESIVSHLPNSVQTLMANIHSIVAPSDPPVLRGTQTYDRTEYEVFNEVNSQMSVNLRRLVSANRSISDLSGVKHMQSWSLRPSIFRMLEDAIKNYDACQYEQSPQQLVYGLYTLLSLTLARGYTMIDFSYTLLKLHNKGNFTIEKQLSNELYEHYSKGMLKNCVDTMNRMSSAYTKCDPIKHVEGQTFEMVTELLQGYIENEVDLNSRTSCLNNCASYKHTQVKGCYLPETQYCGKHRRCKGQVHDCKFFEADANVCISEKPYRRYDWIEYESKKKLGDGNKAGCNNIMKVDSWWRWFYHCSYCVCLCDDPHSPTTDRYISLQPVVSDIAKGMIVTGIKFSKKNRIIHAQIKQGQALAQGQIDPQTDHWVNVKPMSVGTKKFLENKDYVVLDYLTRKIDLDHLSAPKDHVITGVKFGMLGPHVNLEVWVTPINFTTGELAPNLSYWVNNDNTPIMTNNPRKELILVNPDDPRKSPSESEVDSHSNMFVTLQPTSMRGDVSQLTVPFFDAQPVAPIPPSWLHGIQLYHRGRENYGGFLGFTVFSYNLTRHFHYEVEKIKHL